MFTDNRFGASKEQRGCEPKDKVSRLARVTPGAGNAPEFPWLRHF